MILRKMDPRRDHVETALAVALVAVTMLQAVLLVASVRAIAGLF